VKVRRSSLRLPLSYRALTRNVPAVRIAPIDRLAPAIERGSRSAALLSFLVLYSA
jgi:hypothetical protein